MLDTGTKGTGAEMVPLEKVLKKPASRKTPDFVPPQPRPRPPAPPEPRRPRRFKVVDVLAGEVMAEHVDARATVAVLDDVQSLVDVRVYVWQPKAKRWRLLTLAEQKALWAKRRIT